MDKKKIMLNNMYGIQLAKTNVSVPKEMEEIIHDIIVPSESENQFEKNLIRIKEILDNYMK